jgi:hypothetical protein
MRVKSHALHFTFHVALCICVLTTSLGLVGCRSGGIRVRSWEEAIAFAQSELETAGELEGRLEGYAQTADRLSASIEALEQARPALALIGQLRDVRVPLIGNGWQILLALLSLATADGAKVIAKLEETLRALAELKASLDELQGLPAVAEAARAFRANPTRHTLSAWADASTSATPYLSRLHTDLGEVLDPLKDIAGKLSGLVKGLRGAADAGIPAVSDAAHQAAEGIGAIEDPLLALRDGLDQLYQDIGGDVQVLENIQEAVRQAREHGE